MHLLQCETWHMDHEVHLWDDRFIWIQLCKSAVMTKYQVGQISNEIFMKVCAE